jgi:glycosyltransferase involved in cell wall biosynthesis
VLNEAAAIGKVLEDIPPELAGEIVVVDNGSDDRSPEIARAYGARVIFQPERGYGAACQAGIAALNRPDIIVFLDGDYSDHSDEMNCIVAPILQGKADLVIGSRITGTREPGSLPPHSVFGSWLAEQMLWHLHRHRSTDMGPFRAIRADALMELGMTDRAFGWTMEMQAKAARATLRVKEVPVSYRRRIGKSKITGTLLGSVKAGLAIIKTVVTTLRWQPDDFA